MTNMIDNPPERIPASLVAGDTLLVAAAQLASSYPASNGWTLMWIMSPIKGGTPMTVVATDGLAAWNIAIADEVTVTWQAGIWNWLVRATKSGQSIAVDQGSVDVRPNPAAVNLDQRSHAQRTLDLVEAAIEGRASKADLEHQFEDGRRIKYMNHAELLAMRDAYAAKVAAEHRKARGQGPARLLARL